MADINGLKRNDNDIGEAGRTDVGVVPGDTITSALDPFGTVAGEAQDNKAGEGTVDDDFHGSKTRD
ncbi:hypothetical protein [Bacillus sp. JJ1474]|uniref:hypothetical protein n=1 Tax=Bacillus sp. JJ1474 TaxID=3122955 RepID=UPI002FFE8F2E